MNLQPPVVNMYDEFNGRNMFRPNPWVGFGQTGYRSPLIQRGIDDKMRQMVQPPGDLIDPSLIMKQAQASPQAQPYRPNVPSNSTPTYGALSSGPFNPQGPPPLNPMNPGTMANARQQEIAYANEPIPGTMANARQQEIAYANGPKSTPVTSVGDNRNMQAGDVPLPPERPGRGDLGGKMFMIDYGDGSVLRPFFAKDGKMPEIPGAVVFDNGGGGGGIGGILSGLFGS